MGGGYRMNTGRDTLGILATILLSGCASTQLNYNTVELSNGLDSIYIKDTLNNISKFIDNNYAIPSQMIIGAGTFQTVNTVNPSLTIPFTPQVAQTVTNVVTGAASSTTGSNVHTLGAIGPAVSATNTQQQNFTVAPTNDAVSLMNQQALYQHAVWGTSLIDTYVPNRVFVNNNFYYDPYALQKPQCVLCAKVQGSFTKIPVGNRNDIVVNPRLAKGRWIKWDISGADDFVDLGRYGDHELWIRKVDYSDGVLTNFVLATLAYTFPSETFGGGGPTTIRIEYVPPTKGAPGAAGSAGTPQVIVPQVVVPQAAPPASNYRLPPTGVPGFNLVIPQQINP
jgi:hypothetical protein